MTKRLSGGFDLRVRVDLQKEDLRQANQYLMPENRTPICADPSVWKRPDDVDDFMAQDTVSYPLGLRGNFDDFVASLRERGITTTNLVPVCLTISETKAAAFRKHFGTNYFVNAPDEERLLSNGWRFLGFDTVELNGLISGLKGIGYKEPTWSQLRAQFGEALNEEGLFSDEITASRFAQTRGAEIPAHAPFDVVGVLALDALP